VLSLILQATSFVLYLLGAIPILGNWIVVGRGFYWNVIRRQPHKESLVPLVGTVLVLLGTIAAWNHGWLWWVGIVLLVFDMPFFLFVAIGVPIAMWRRANKKPD
jgi:hypothetical protein